MLLDTYFHLIWSYFMSYMKGARLKWNIYFFYILYFALTLVGCKLSRKNKSLIITFKTSPRVDYYSLLTWDLLSYIFWFIPWMEELALLTISHALNLSLYSTERCCVKGRGLKNFTKSLPPMVGQTPLAPTQIIWKPVQCSMPLGLIHG
jgi:hypothetical protein